jgi:hypothetical protein
MLLSLSNAHERISSPEPRCLGRRTDRQIQQHTKIGCKWVQKWISETAANRHDLKLHRQREGNGTTFECLV